MLIIIFFIFFINLIYWIFIFSSVSLYSERKKSNIKNNKIITNSAILISLKNEEKNIPTLLSSLLKQNIKDLTIVLVDDYSIDNTYRILDELTKSYPHIILIKNKSKQGKKHAISYALKKIDKEYILLTDADCIVNSKNWAQKMLSKFDKNISIVLAYSPHFGNGFLSKFIRFETFMTALQYFSYYLIGIPYMGVGRNMAIRRSTFIQNKGYANHIDLLSGNDDLYVNENSNKSNTAIQLDPDTFVYTKAKENIKAFLKQKTRHISTSTRYKKIHQVLLGLYSFSHISVYISLIISLFFLPLSTVFLIWAIRIFLIYVTSTKAFIKLRESDLLIYLPVLDFMMFIYYLIITFYYFFTSKNKWK